MIEALNQRYLTPAETATALGVTVRALRIYEQKGLVLPQRSSAGWRAYGPEAFARLHQILVLKQLGLSLQAIGDLLRGRLACLDDLLALQQRVLQDRRTETDRALALLAAARLELAAGRALSLEDLTTLTKETTMTETLSPEGWTDIFGPLIQKHYSPEEIRQFQERTPAAPDYGAESKIWNHLIADIKALMAAGVAPTSKEAMELACQWDTQVKKNYGDDPQQAQKGREMWLEALSNPATAPRLPFDMKLWRYVEEAAGAVKTSRETSS